MKALHRDLLREIERIAPGAQVKTLRERTHRVLEIEYRGKKVQVSCSSSPKNPDYAVRNAVTDVRRALNLPRLVI